jgi:hypothetical protein
MKIIEGNIFSFSLGKTEVSPFQASRWGGGGLLGKRDILDSRPRGIL